MTTHRIVGLETEFGILEPHNVYANPVVLSSELVNAIGEGDTGSIQWDFHGEDPLNDARGYRLERAAADPSQLTDDPEFLAPSGGEIRLEKMNRSQAEQLRRPRAANVLLSNGGRLYVDHAHPEYSSPETVNPREAVLWDRAGEHIANEAMAFLAGQGREVVAYKNNVDGKGAAYGSHENYLVDRSLDFGDIIRYITPFFVTRPILCGAGRVGIGQRSEEPGFQISQRADYVENDIGLETTFNRPIINTRDEPHAQADKWRRFHVIGGDANLFDISNLLKVGTTSLVLWLLEHGSPLGLESVLLEDPVSATWIVSQDPTLSVGLEMRDGTTKTALEIQQIYLELVREALSNGDDGLDFDTAEVMERWQSVLTKLGTDLYSASREVEWVAKLQLLENMRQRGNLEWNNDRLRAVDVQWHDLRPGRSIVHKLDQAGQIERLFSEEEVAYAAAHPPESTRAYLRGSLIKKFTPQVVAAGWDGLVIDVPNYPDLVRIPTLNPELGTRELVGQMIDQSGSIAEFLEKLTGQ